MTDEDGHYEMFDSRGSTLPNQIDVGKKQLGEHTYRSTQLGYDNPVAFDNASSHVYESPSSVATMQEEAQRSAPRQRARMNQVYEGFDSDEGLNKTTIFEAIRKIDHHDSNEGKKQSVFGENTGENNKTENADAIILQSKQIRELQENIKFLEKRFNQIQSRVPEMSKLLKNTTIQLSKMNNSLTSGNYWAHSLKEINNVFDKKFLAFSKNFTWMKDQLSETKTLVNSRKLEIKLNRMNNTINNEVATLKNKIAGKKSFRDCTLKTKKETNVFQQADYGVASVDEPANHTIVGVTCASTMKGKTQYSHLVAKNNGKTTYMCTCSTIDGKKSGGDTSECIMYYWQCPDN